MSDGEHASRRNDRPDSSDDDAEELAAQVELLTEENRRLRSEYRRTKRTTHRRMALGFAAVGVAAVIGAFALPESRTVLLALGGTGLFGAVLTFTLSPGQFIATETSERVYTAHATTGERMIAELGLQEEFVYAPSAPIEGFSSVRLFVPRDSTDAVPSPAELDSLFVVTDDGARGVSFPPTGGSLYHEFETDMADEIAADPAALSMQLADALGGGFEIVESAVAEVDSDGGRATFGIVGSTYGPIDRFDNPVPSFLAVGLAANLETPVNASVMDGDGRTDYLVTCEWDAAVESEAT